jgi:hypothetical protein
MKYIRLVVALLCITTFATAQKAVIPGYQGHRLAVEASFRALPNFFSDGWLGSSDNGLTGNWFKEYGVAATYAISRRKSVQFGVERGRTEYIDDYEVSDPFSNTRYFDIRDKIDYTTLHASIYFNRKGSWAYAPVGPYWGFRFSYSMGKSTMEEYREWNGSLPEWADISTLPTTEIEVKSYRFATPGVGIPFGVRLIPFDRATIDLSMTFTLTSGWKEGLYEGKVDLTPDELQQEERRFNLYLSQGWRLGISAGYLF